MQTSTGTSQSCMVHRGSSSVPAHLGHLDSSIYANLSPFPVPPSGRPNSGHSYLIPPPQFHLNVNPQPMQSFPSAQQDPRWTRNVYQIPSHFPQPFLLPGQAPSTDLVCPPFSVRVQGVQPALQPHLPLSSSMLYARALGPVAYTAPQVFHTPSAPVPSLPSPPPRVPPPLPPSSPIGCPRACVMNHSAALFPFHINQYWYDPSSRPSLHSEDDLTQNKEHEPQLPTSRSSCKSNSVEIEQSVHVSMYNDERTSAAADIEASEVKEDEKKNKRYRSSKPFKAALVKVVKKVLYPFWQQSCMTRVVFKTIVQKTVDKVLCSLKPHQIPKSQARINCYIESSRSRLTKLVMGYIEKYVRV